MGKRLVLAVALVLTVVPFVDTTAAGACSCVPGTPEEKFEQAEVVFAGEVTDVVTQYASNRASFRLDVSQVFKGEIGTEAEVVGASQSPACGPELEQGVAYVVHATRNRGELSTSSCSGNVPVDLAAPDSLPPRIGEGEPPSPDITIPSDDGRYFFARNDRWAKAPLLVLVVGASLLAAGTAVALRRRSLA